MTDSGMMMSRAETFRAAGENFLHAEKVCLEAQQNAAPNDGALFFLADALGSIAYGLKLLNANMADAEN